MFERILVAVDGSALSDGLLDTAIQFALVAGSRLHFVAVVEVPKELLTAEGANEPAVEASLTREANRVLAAAVARAQEGGIEADAAAPTAMGVPAPEAVVEESRSWGADLIVVGAHARHGLRRLVHHHFAESVARSADRSVLFVHPQR